MIALESLVLEWLRPIPWYRRYLRPMFLFLAARSIRDVVSDPLGQDHFAAWDRCRNTGSRLAPLGTVDNYKIYAVNFKVADHLHCIQEEAQTIIDGALAVEPKRNQGRASPTGLQQTASEAKEEWRNEGNPN